MPKSVRGFTGLLDIPTDYQAHHRLPQQLADNPFLKQLGGVVDITDFGTNGIALPKDVATGVTSGQTPHLGSHPAYTNFIEGLLDTATSNYDPSVPLTPSQLDEFGGRVNAIQAYSRMALSGLLPDSNVTPSGRVPLNSRDPMILSGDPAEVRAFYNQLDGDLQSKGFTTPESLDRLVDFPRYELLNQANAFDPNLTAAQRTDLARNVDDVRASLEAGGRTDLTSALNDAARGRYTLNGSTQSGAPTGASPDLLQGVESATGRSFATGLTAPESLGTIGSSDFTPLQSVSPPDVATTPQIEQPSLLPEQPSLSPDAAPTIQNNPVVQDNQAPVRNATTDLPEMRAPAIAAEVPELGSALPETPAPLELPSTSPARESATVPDLTPRAPASELPAEINGAATGRFTPNFVGVIGQSPTASKIFTGAGVLGAVGLAADAGITGYNAYQMYDQGDTLGAGHEVAGFGGRLGGSLTGAYLLGEAGALGGPWGALGGAIVGGIGGAILGDKGVKSLYDSLTGYQPPAAAAAPTPAWPDQFAAEFDLANGGGPFSDPMTGFQVESQADYDARRQSYVDSKMADQQTQGQQMLDTLRLTPGVDPNALPADPTASPLPAAPTEPTPDAPLDTPPANTGSSLAPLNADPEAIDGLTPTSIGFDGNLGGVTTAVPDLSLSPDTTGLSLDGGLNTGLDPALGSFDTGLNSNLGLGSSLDTGLTSDATGGAALGLNSGLDSSFNSGLNSGLDSGFNSGLNSGLNSSLDSGFNSGLDSSFNSGLDSGFNSSLDSSFNSGLDSGLDSGFNSGLNSGLNSSLDSGFNSGLDSSFNSGLDSGFNSSLDSSFNSGLDSSFNSGLDSSFSSGSSFDSGLGSSSGFSDFGDSSFGGDSFSSGSFGGDMGPVVLDLAGQGIRITDLGDSHAAFDADDNGVRNRIAWTTPDEGLLAFDANGSGTVDQTSELALQQWTPGAQTDLQGLGIFDTNHDGALDAPDRDFGRFGVWRDGNSNGVSDPGELNSLVEAGVSAISLASDGMQSHLPDGSTIYGQGSFTRTDGTSGRLADVALAYGPDINAARDQLVGAMAVGPSGAAGATAPMSSPVAVVGPMLAADVVSPFHARPA
ncbi:hypothetical protein AB7M17_008105 [Bradyrhizobium sp. USDA 377]